MIKTKEETQKLWQALPTPSSRSPIANLLVLGGGLVLIFISCRLIYEKFTSVISRDATINGVVIELKAPSAGQVTQLDKKAGEKLTKGELLSVLENNLVSQLKIKEITSRLNKQQTELDKDKAYLVLQLRLLKTLEADQQNQYKLQVRRVHDEIMQANAEVEKAQAKYQLAQKKYNRSNFLAEKGAISQENLDLTFSEQQEGQAEVKHWQARLQQLLTEKNAAQLDLSLGRSSSNYDPKIRLQELQMDIANQQQAILSLQQAVKDSQAELTTAHKDFQQQHQVTVKTPASGVIWRLDARQGQFLKEGDSLGAILDCNRRWIDVYVDEQALRSLRIGTPATIQPYGLNDKTFQGRITLVRSGVGRLTPGEDVAIPLKNNLPRQSQVRVEFESEANTLDIKHFCYVGYTARVLFQVR